MRGRPAETKVSAGFGLKRGNETHVEAGNRPRLGASFKFRRVVVVLGNWLGVEVGLDRRLFSGRREKVLDNGDATGDDAARKGESAAVGRGGGKEKNAPRQARPEGALPEGLNQPSDDHRGRVVDGEGERST